MSWDDALNDLKMEHTPMVYVSSLIGRMKLTEEEVGTLAEAMLMGGDYELDFLYSFTAHLADLMADIEQIGKDADGPMEFSVEELLYRNLQNMGVKGI